VEFALLRDGDLIVGLEIGGRNVLAQQVGVHFDPVAGLLGVHFHLVAVVVADHHDFWFLPGLDLDPAVVVRNGDNGPLADRKALLHAMGGGGRRGNQHQDGCCGH
jgi:hypothetical protein